MCSLTGIYPIVSKSGLHNDTRGRNMWPLHRNTQPSITASPSSGADKHIVLAFIQKLLVDFLYFPSYILIVRCTVMIGFDIHNIVYLVHNAMPQRVVGTKQHVFVRNSRKILVQHIFTVHNRTHLKQIECTGLITVVIERHGKFDLYRTAHLLLTITKHPAQDACQRKYIVLQDVGKRDHFAPSGIQTVPNHLIVRIVSRGNITQRTVFFGFLHM